MTIDTRSVTKADFLDRAIAGVVYESLLSVYRHHRLWLSDKCRDYPWESEEFKNKFIDRLIAKVEIAGSPNDASTRLLSIIAPFLEKEFFISIYSIDLVSKIQRIFQAYSTTYLSMILLDAENLSLDYPLEAIVQKNSRYPIQVKYAFANWRNLGKQDSAFHQRGYHLIHVPPDKNNADLKMTSFGLSLALSDARIREVFVCSSDRDLHHLSNSLLSNGLQCYRVFRRDNDLIVHDVNTARERKYSPITSESILSLEEGIRSIKEIVRQGCEKAGCSWLKLSDISTLFRQKHNLTLSQFVSYYRPGQRARDLFLEYKNDFGFHQVDEKSEIYISLFQVLTPDTDNKETIEKKFTEREIEDFITRCIEESDKEKGVLLSYLASQFFKQRSISLKQVTEELEFGNKLPKVLARFEKFTIHKEDNNYYI